MTHRLGTDTVTDPDVALSRAADQTLPEVEHVTIGRHRFPLFSHPVFRAKAADDAYVRHHVETQLRQPELQKALQSMVERLLRQGAEAATEEDVNALLLDDQLAQFDAYWYSSDSHPPLEANMRSVMAAAAAEPQSESPTPGLQSSTDTFVSEPSWLPARSSLLRGTRSKPQSHEVALFPKRSKPGIVSSSYQKYDERSACVPNSSGVFAHDRGLPVSVPVFGPGTAVQQKRAMHRLPPLPTNDAHALTSAETLSVKHSRVLPEVQPNTVSAQQLLLATTLTVERSADSSHSLDPTRTEDGSEKRGGGSSERPSPPPHGCGTTSQRGVSLQATLPIWRQTMRSAVYSLLRANAQANAQGTAIPATVPLLDMDRTGYSSGVAVRAVDTSTLLSSCSPDSYAAMDVLLDGNSTCLSRRSRPCKQSPRQQSALLLAASSTSHHPHSLAGRKGNRLAKDSGAGGRPRALPLADLSTGLQRSRSQNQQTPTAKWTQAASSAAAGAVSEPAVNSVRQRVQLPADSWGEAGPSAPAVSPATATPFSSHVPPRASGERADTPSASSGGAGCSTRTLRSVAGKPAWEHAMRRVREGTYI